MVSSELFRIFAASKEFINQILHNMELRNHIEAIIKETFDIIDNLYKENQEIGNGIFNSGSSRLVFPKYRNKDKIRVSEQELRFLFVELFNKYCTDKELNLFYSIETPSEEPYDFGATPKKHCIAPEGESAQFDMVIFNESKERVCLIEFKNNSNDAGEHEKDFLKLSVEGKGKEKLCYFISLAESSDNGTLGENQDAKQGIIPKFKRFKDNDEICYDNITYICHCINNRGTGFNTIYAGIVTDKVKDNYGWEEISKIFEK